MSATDTLPDAPGWRSWSPLQLRRAWLSMDQNPAAQRFATSLVGRFVVLGAYCAALLASNQLSTAALGLVALTLGAILVAPAYRLAILCGASAFFFILRPFRIDGWADLTAQKAQLIGIPPLALQASAALAVLVTAWAYLAWQKANLRAFPAQRPVFALIVMWFALALATWLLPLGQTVGGFLWVFTGTLISSLWIFAYAAIDNRGKDDTPIPARAALMRPFWGGSAAPIGKSLGYLNKFDAKSDADLGKTRLKALKLAVWAVMLTGVLAVTNVILKDLFGLPDLQSAIVAFAEGDSLPRTTNWASLVSNYFVDLLIISIWGHMIVSVVRMAGYAIPRNTVNPLASRTLAEFWNRYFFYFKELLVDLFFYPAFLRFFKKQPKLRIAFATLCAAGLGNFLYHFMRETYIFADRPFLEALAVFQSAAFYSLALAAGLIISQLRKKKPTAEDGFFAYHIRPRLGVIAFFCFLKVFDDISGEGTFLERVAFFGALFGL
ncbi:MAG: hypothetical protein AAGM04_03410 [Pseudomonadota bacterium]